MGHIAECAANGNRESVRRNKGRKRFYHPATSEPQYSPDELEFMLAMHQYIQTSGHKFPTFSEHLKVLKGLGYSKEKEIVSANCRTKNRGA